MKSKILFFLFLGGLVSAQVNRFFYEYKFIPDSNNKEDVKTEMMMLDIDFAELRAGFIKNFPLGLALAVVLFVELFVGLIVRGAGSVALGKADGSAAQAADASNIQAIGALLYSRYLFLFEAAGIVLLVAMIGAIVLTHRQRSDTRGQNISKQNARRPEEATINLQPEIGKGVQI